MGGSKLIIWGTLTEWDTPCDKGDIFVKDSLKPVILPMPMFSMHRTGRIGTWYSVKTVENSLWALGEVECLNVIELIKNNELGGLSVGFKTIRFTDRVGGRYIEEAELWEASVVDFGMHKKAVLLGWEGKDA